MRLIDSHCHLNYPGLVEAIVMLAQAVEPVIPQSARRLIEFILLGRLTQPQPIFPRLELEEEAV